MPSLLDTTKEKCFYSFPTNIKAFRIVCNSIWFCAIVVRDVCLANLYFG